MAKREYRQAQRVLPIGEAGIAKVREIVAGHQFAKVNEVAVDAFSASAILAVYDKLNEQNRAKFLTLPVAKAASVAFKLCA